MLWNGTVVVLCLIALVAAGELRAKKPTTTITGIVKSAETYRGKIRSVYIEGREEGDFLVARGTEIGKELLKQVGETVTATGYVRESVRDLEFDHVIDVLSYEINRPREQP
jgi:hypothetical protein